MEVLSYTILDCPECGVTFGLSKQYEQRRREDHRSFFCPSGHTMWFGGKSKAEQEAERLRTELAQEKQRREQAAAEAEWQRAQRETAEGRLRAAKDRITKLAKRVARGTCPCCGVGFPDLRAHMAQAHPEFTPERVADVDRDLAEPTRPIEQPAPDDLKARGATIRARREALGWSRTELGERIGIGPGTVGLIEGGHYATVSSYARAEAALAEAEAGGTGHTDPASHAADAEEVAALGRVDVRSPTPDAPNPET